MSADPAPGADALPSLSVVMACRNGADALPETLEALAAQVYPGWWEVVFVDNGSTDDTVEVAGRYADRFERWTLRRNPDPGYQPSAINHGIATSTGEVIAFLDADDLVETDYLLHLGRALRTAELVGGKVDITRLNSPEVQRRRRPLQTERIETYDDYLPAVVGAAMGSTRAAMELVGGWDASLPTQHDLDVCWRLHRAGVRAEFVPEAVLHYRYREGASQVWHQELGYGEGEVALYRRHRAHGMPRRGPAQVLVSCARVLLAVLTAWRPGGRERVATQVGHQVGRVRGSLRYRTLFL
ncbi:Glycosyl transferase family 2 [Nocardioides scoriae]|uniref:Glycosyl transferase family 2 n=1 Tax=Nocardioides scoriae TaxID=642780 RepID=A0A1H1UYP6_9ACTN|nr:glycosyltransferase [Nocardioides scoriae]SDS77573.1 Glycosyl transferase family 2 [Nocardioides scoriae]